MKKPLYVKLGLFGVPTKKAANMYMYFCVVVAILSLILGLVLDQKYFPGMLLILAALWYYLSIKWMDKNNAWRIK